MATKQNEIRSSLNRGIKKKDIKATEEKAKEVDNTIKNNKGNAGVEPSNEENQSDQVLQPKEEEAGTKKKKEENKDTIKTSVDFQKDLYMEMKIYLIRNKMNMRKYLENLVAKDLKRRK